MIAKINTILDRFEYDIAQYEHGLDTFDQAILTSMAEGVASAQEDGA
ncbi:hypothetical protein [Methylococcus sp. EFPC2]|nr:hypothetical protein [Methylococcus sp. EFPC2]QSA99333.1 hypothetical protein JWZ97_19895 [Methylococcus sp. EFPC2]